MSFELKRGECLGLIGHNGAGKSTLLKILNGLIKPDQGRVEMRGRIGALIELGAGFNPILTGRENIYNKGAILGFTRKEIDKKFDEIVDFAEIDDFIDMPVQNYSSGMKVRLGFAVSAQMEPDVLIIDEVLAVGDLGFVIKCLNRMAEIIPNTCVIFVSHNMPMVNRICTSAMLLDRGRKEYHGTDVAHALERYVHKFSQGQKANQGNGMVEVERIGLRTTSDEEWIYDNSFIHHNATPLQACFEFRVFDRNARPFWPAFIILDQQLREIVNCAPESEAKVFYPKRIKNWVRIEVNLPVLYLNSGKHTITALAIEPESQTIYCRTTNAASFVVRAPTMSCACTVIRCPWCEPN